MTDAERGETEREDVLERLRERTSFRTHWEGCEEDDRHLDCAAAKEIERLRAELAVTDALLQERMAALALIPPCDAHGSGCVPHAREWIKAHTPTSAVPPSPEAP